MRLASITPLAGLAGLALAALLCSTGTRAAAGTVDGAGRLFAIKPDGQPIADCPLKHTAVQARISGPLARVTVVQEFANEAPDRIEAVYTFPLPANAAVDDMTLKVGGRTIKGRIKEREEARRIYDDARRQGYLAGLLDQQRPNVFTQAVANIQPGETVRVEISYVDLLPYEAGRYEFRFPMVVGPRYTPAGQAPMPQPRYLSVTSRSPHDLSLNVELDAGVPLDAIESTSHEIALERASASQARITLAAGKVVPNKDFILRYHVAGKQVNDAVLTHHDARGGFFTLLLTPPEQPRAVDITPKELVFVIDTSGSMSGLPIEKAKEAMKHAIDGLHPRDTFNLITFAGDTHILFPQPVAATPENVRRAQAFLAGQYGGGGTEMMKAIRAALAPSGATSHIRVVCFMTDGYVGNEDQILREIKANPGARIFSFGIGSSVNHYLLDKMAEFGRGDVEYVALNDNGSTAAQRFHERVRSPLLTDIKLDWGGLAVRDVFPAEVPDLFSAKPLVVTGRYDQAGRGTIRLTGRQNGREVVREIAVNLPAHEPRHDVLATLWARRKVDHLMTNYLLNRNHSRPTQDQQQEITGLGIDFRLMTPFTSFVAVEEHVVTQGGEARRVEVPVELPEGVIVGESNSSWEARPLTAPTAIYPATPFVPSPRAAESSALAGMPPTAMPQRRLQDVGAKPAQPDAMALRVEAKLRSLVTRWQNGGNVTAAERALVSNGKLRVKVQASAAGLAELARLGFQPVAKGTMPEFEVSVADVATLAQTAGVLFISLA